MTNEQINIAIAEACGWCNIILHTQDQWHFLTSKELVAMNGSTLRTIGEWEEAK